MFRPPMADLDCERTGVYWQTPRDDAKAQRPRDARRRGVFARLVRLTVLGLVVAALAGLAIGFVQFAETVSRMQRPAIAGKADAIVALTGGAARIADAVQLLNEGRGRRLLISGVNPDTTPAALASYAPGLERYIDCCVDLGYAALNTLGNAKEARNWARRLGFTRLIVVTSSYHLPRSLFEIQREMPEAQLLAYPVISEGSPRGDWWRDPAATRLLLAEYGKYLLAMVRLRWRPSTTWDVEAAALAE